MGSAKVPGPYCQEEKPISIDGGTSCLGASPISGPTGSNEMMSYAMSGGGKDVDDVSFEMDDAPYMSVPTRLSGLTAPQMRVLAWLQKYKLDIVAAEQRWRVDRRAIAGAIAWEALENWNIGGFKIPHGVRAVGAAKVHVYNSKNPMTNIVNADENTVAKQVEDGGYLPKQSLADRKKLLATPEGAITYVAAIMRAFSEMAVGYGFQIGGDPVILTNLFQEKDLPKWKASLEKKKATGITKLSGGNEMDIWVGRNLLFLEDAVGRPNLQEYGF